MNGGYDDGYNSCACFWGENPGSLINIYETLYPPTKSIRVCDLGCGEGKNSIHFARKGADVFAYDISASAIKNAINAWHDSGSVNWEIADVRKVELGLDNYDLIIAYGLFHCLSRSEDIEKLVNRMKFSVKIGGAIIACTFNDRFQDLSGHENFSPLLLSHTFYMELFDNFELLYCTDEDLVESHPNNHIVHSHSLTRLIAKRIK